MYGVESTGAGPARMPQNMSVFPGTWLAPERARKQGQDMQGTKLLGAILLGLGILAVAYGGFSYVKDTEKINLGPINIEVQDKERVNIPLWAGVAVAIAGGVLLARKS